ELVTGLIRRGVQVTLVSFGEIPTAQQVSWMDGLDGLDYRPTGFHLEWMQDAEADIEASSDYLASIVREVRPDVLHLNQYCYGCLPVDVPRIVVAHSDVVSWWVAVHGEEPRASRWMSWYRGTVKQGLQAATAVVAPSEWMLNSLAAHYIRPAQASVIYNGRDPNLFNPHITKEEYAVSVGRIWDGGKQVSLLRQIDPPLPIYVAGSEDHPESAVHPQAARRTAKKSRLRFKGTQSEGQLRHLFSRAAIYAATSRYEPFGLAPLEAALSRCAVVANEIPTFHEIWGDAAYYFRLNDPASLQEALRQLTEDRELRREYATRAYDRARRHYTADRMTEGYLELYQSVVRTEAAAA
ncbi:MAG TPA: glycosyltransferase family 4 protein, partial [Terriglobales bacterium]|nr:glycosyltransferase family 4 protein [Terriglobales bacterium]